MKFACTKENLNYALNLVSPLASRQSNLPILVNVLIVATEAKVELVATNLEMAARVSLRAKVEEAGTFTVPAKTISDYVHLLPAEQVEFSLQENELVVKCGASSTKIKGAPADEFPVVPNIDEEHAYSIDAVKLAEALTKTAVAAAKNEIRPELAGVYAGLNTERYPGLILAATDSYRLAEAKIAVAQGEDESRCIIPVRTVYELIRLIGVASGDETETRVRLWVSENQIAIRYRGFEMTARLVDGIYPDYVQIIPAQFKTNAVFPVAVMINKIKAAGLFTTTGVNAVSFDLNASENTVSISSTSTQTGAHNSTIDADVVGEENSILLNHRYVLDGLQQMVEEVEFKVNSASTPCLFKPRGKDDYLYIVMPIRQ